ncbi:non-ribosomal peptide synthetase [Xenorhabdus vietnamensis]|uniref:Non-ribosomal peptide synthetase n=2 Tax=Xenorhabdus vietnamensis TaxID=351656 RepID=A0A1Y2S7S5_9GAMM|nr:non-ribosomal peptide synthetase [Xenorhabdus vietnamensis]
MMASENADPLLLNINGGVQAGQLGFSVASHLSEEKSQQFKAAFETALDLVISTAQIQAISGGIKTPSDYGKDLLTNDRLNDLMTKFERNQSQKIKVQPKKKKILEI